MCGGRGESRCPFTRESVELPGGGGFGPGAGPRLGPRPVSWPWHHQASRHRRDHSAVRLPTASRWSGSASRWWGGVGAAPFEESLWGLWPPALSVLPSTPVRPVASSPVGARARLTAPEEGRGSRAGVSATPGRNWDLGHNGEAVTESVHLRPGGRGQVRGPAWRPATFPSPCGAAWGVAVRHWCPGGSCPRPAEDEPLGPWLRVPRTVSAPLPRPQVDPGC